MNIRDYITRFMIWVLSLEEVFFWGLGGGREYRKRNMLVLSRCDDCKRSLTGRRKVGYIAGLEATEDK
jgi:hypothetical protein